MRQSTNDSNDIPHFRQNTLNRSRGLAKSIKTRKSAPKKMKPLTPFKGVSVLMPVPLTISVCARFQASAEA